MNKIFKIIIISVFILSFAVISAFSWLYYSGRVNTYQPITIKNANNEKVNFKVHGISPFGKVFPLIQVDSINVQSYYMFCKQIEIQFQASNKICKHNIEMTIGNFTYHYKIIGNNRFIKPVQDRGNISFWRALVSVFHWHISKLLIKIFFIATIIFLLLFNIKIIIKSIKKLLSFLSQSRKTLLINFSNNIIAINKYLQFSNKKIPYNNLTILFCVIALSPFLYLPFFSFPSPEEIQISADTIKFGFNYVGFDYNTKDGRFFTSFLYVLSPLSWHSIFGYQLMLLTFIISLWGSFYFFLSSILNNLFNKKKIFEWTLLLIVLFTCLMPSVASGYYWLFAVITYIVPLILLLNLLSLLIRNSNKKLSVYKLIIISILIVIICGSHEIFIPIIISLLFLLTVFSFYSNSNNKWCFFSLLMLSLIVVYFVFSAPGHSNRINVNQTQHRKILDLFGTKNLFKTINFAYKSVIESFYWYIFKNPIIILLSLLSFPVLYKIKSETHLLKKIITINPLWAILAFLLLMILPVMPYFIVGENSYLYMNRLFNIICFLFIIAWFYMLLVLAVFIKKYKFIQNFFEIIKNKPFIIILRWVVIILFIFYVFYPTNNICVAYIDIFSGRTNNYRHQMEIRFKKMNKPLHNIYNNHSLLVVDSVNDKPKSIHYQDYDITGFNNMFREGVADYFHVNEVRYFTDTIPYRRPPFMKECIFCPEDFKDISINFANPVFGIGLLPSFICGLYGTDTLTKNWFLYKDFNFGYNMYDSTLRIFSRLWIDDNTNEFIPVITVKFANIKGDTIYKTIIDTLKPKILEPSSFIAYDKLKLNHINSIDKSFVYAILENRITFVLSSRLINPAR